MIHFAKDMRRSEEAHAQGGAGVIHFQHLFSSEELGGRMKMCSIVTLQPGDSVGEHPHKDNGEVYFILTGGAMIAEDGVETELFAGDAEFCADGHTHAIRNHTDSPMSFLALIVPNP